MHLFTHSGYLYSGRCRLLDVNLHLRVNFHEQQRLIALDTPTKQTMVDILMILVREIPTEFDHQPLIDLPSSPVR